MVGVFFYRGNEALGGCHMRLRGVSTTSSLLSWFSQKKLMDYAYRKLAALSDGGLPLVLADAVYTERYMGRPSENSDSYKVNLTQF